MKRIGSAARSLGIVMILVVGMSAAAHAQPPGPQGNALTGQSVDSRKGYVARIPNDFRLDSASSGWNPKKRFEVRVYRAPGVGIIRLTVTVRPITMPHDTVNNGSYIYTQADSAAERGNAIIRTFYLPTRSVRFELIPQSIRMARYLESSEEIFGTFRWKPGANTEAVETDPPAGK